MESTYPKIDGSKTDLTPASQGIAAACVSVSQSNDKKVAPIIDADESNKALVLVRRLRTRETRQPMTRAKVSRAANMFCQSVRDLQPPDVDAALRGTMFADAEEFDAGQFVDRVCSEGA